MICTLSKDKRGNWVLFGAVDAVSVTVNVLSNMSSYIRIYQSLELRHRSCRRIDGPIYKNGVRYGTTKVQSWGQDSDTSLFKSQRRAILSRLQRSQSQHPSRLFYIKMKPQISQDLVSMSILSNHFNRKALHSPLMFRGVLLFSAPCKPLTLP